MIIKCTRHKRARSGGFHTWSERFHCVSSLFLVGEWLLIKWLSKNYSQSEMGILLYHMLLQELHIMNHIRCNVLLWWFQKQLASCPKRWCVSRQLTYCAVGWKITLMNLSTSAAKIPSKRRFTIISNLLKISGKVNYSLWKLIEYNTTSVKITSKSTFKSILDMFWELWYNSVQNHEDNKTEPIFFFVSGKWWDLHWHISLFPSRLRGSN